MPIGYREIGAGPHATNVTTAHSADVHSTDSHAEPSLSSRHPSPGGAFPPQPLNRTALSAVRRVD